MRATDSTTPARTRIESIDLVRGLVMIVMLLDHMRDFLHRDGLTADPLDPATTSIALYVTRWVTHLCAPSFVFLAGVSAHLQLQRGLPKRDLSRFLISRGLFLVALELLVLRPLIWFQLDLNFAAHLQVIGWSMVILAGLIHAPVWAIALFGFSQLLLHNLLDGVTVAWPAASFLEVLWSVLHQRNAISLGSSGSIAFLQYPLIPWCGVMALGFLAGCIFDADFAGRRRSLMRWGAACLLGFFALRASNFYGDPRPWSAPRGEQGEALANWRTALSFFNVEKYPPSLLYLLATLSFTLLALAAFAVLDTRRLPPWLKPVIVFGRVPLFFYVLQWPIVHFTAWLLQWINGQPWGFDRQSIFNPGVPEGAGFGLPGVYLGWAIGLLVLYPACAQFAALKRRNKARWLSYL